MEEIKEIALQHGIPSGRGMKQTVLVNKILQANGTETEAPKKAKVAKKKAAPVKEATITSNYLRGSRTLAVPRTRC